MAAPRSTRLVNSNVVLITNYYVRVGFKHMLMAPDKDGLCSPESAGAGPDWFVAVMPQTSAGIAPVQATVQQSRWGICQNLVHHVLLW